MPSELLSARALGVDLSGIRRVFELGAKLEDPINLSIGQPDFPVADDIKRAAAAAIDADHNGYTLTQGVAPLLEACRAHLTRDLGWRFGRPNDPGLFISSGTSGALMLAMLSLLDPGDEIVIPDPYFVAYPHAATLCGATAVRCDTYPDFRMTAGRVEPLITDKTKAVLLNAPSNPGGVALTTAEVRDLLELCTARGVVLISDEIYDEFCFSDAPSEPAADPALGDRCPSPARTQGASDHVLVVRGFGKTYGVTGWRLGYTTGPRWLIDAMVKTQQYTFVCPPAPLQHGVIPAIGSDVSAHVAEYQKRRDAVIEILGDTCDIVRPDGAFYMYVGLPERARPASRFIERCLENNLLIIPGAVFSSRDTHVRLSLAAPTERVIQGAEIIRGLVTD